MKLILIVDDHPLVYSGLENAASARPGLRMELVRSLAEARVRLREEPRPDLVLLDIQLGDGSGFTLIEEAQAEGRAFPFAILTSSRDWNHLNRAMGLGAPGFLLKDAECEELVADLERILNGESVFPAAAPGAQKTPFELVRAFHALSEREKEVLKYIRSGLMNREVAERMGIGLRTVETYRAQACEKLGVRTPIQLSSTLLELKHLL